MQARIDYIPPADQVGTNQVRVYRQQLTAGQSMTVTVTPSSGDPDLYVWLPNETLPLVSDQAGQVVDQVTLVAAVSGLHQIEVYGYTAASYSIEIVVTNGTGLARAETLSAMSVSPSDTKPTRSEPVIPLTDAPSEQTATPSSASYPIQVTNRLTSLSLEAWESEDVENEAECLEAPKKLPSA